MSKEKPLTQVELLQWVVAVIKRESDQGTYGTVTVHLDKGRIVRAKVERNELPENRT